MLSQGRVPSVLRPFYVVSLSSIGGNALQYGCRHRSQSQSAAIRTRKYSFHRANQHHSPGLRLVRGDSDDADAPARGRAVRDGAGGEVDGCSDGVGAADNDAGADDDADASEIGVVVGDGVWRMFGGIADGIKSVKAEATVDDADTGAG